MPGITIGLDVLIGPAEKRQPAAVWLRIGRRRVGHNNSAKQCTHQPKSQADSLHRFTSRCRTAGSFV
jgi:hypothetical protein